MKGRNMLMTSVCWGMLAVVHALPALALFRPTLISSLYGVEAGSSTYLLLHHRAALFLVIFVICAWGRLSARDAPAGDGFGRHQHVVFPAPVLVGADRHQPCAALR